MGHEKDEPEGGGKEHRPDDNNIYITISDFPHRSTSLFPHGEQESLGSEFHDWSKEVEIEERDIDEGRCRVNPNPVQSYDLYQQIREYDELFPDWKRHFYSNLNNDDKMNAIYTCCTGLFSDEELRKLGLQWPDSPQVVENPSQWRHPELSSAEEFRKSLQSPVNGVVENPSQCRHPGLPSDEEFRKSSQSPVYGVVENPSQCRHPGLFSDEKFSKSSQSPVYGVVENPSQWPDLEHDPVNKPAEDAGNLQNLPMMPIQEGPTQSSKTRRLLPPEGWTTTRAKRSNYRKKQESERSPQGTYDHESRENVCKTSHQAHSRRSRRWRDPERRAGAGAGPREDEDKDREYLLQTRSEPEEASNNLRRLPEPAPEVGGSRPSHSTCSVDCSGPILPYSVVVAGKPSKSPYAPRTTAQCRRPLPEGWEVTEKIRRKTGAKDRVIVETSTGKRFQSFRSAWKYIDSKTPPQEQK